jgi:hypothetical protein
LEECGMPSATLTCIELRHTGGHASPTMNEYATADGAARGDGGGEAVCARVWVLCTTPHARRLFVQAAPFSAHSPSALGEEHPASGPLQCPAPLTPTGLPCAGAHGRGDGRHAG